MVVRVDQSDRGTLALPIGRLLEVKPPAWPNSEDCANFLEWPGIEIRSQSGDGNKVFHLRNGVLGNVQHVARAQMRVFPQIAVLEHLLQVQLLRFRPIVRNAPEKPDL